MKIPFNLRWEPDDLARLDAAVVAIGGGPAHAVRSSRASLLLALFNEWARRNPGLVKEVPREGS